MDAASKISEAKIQMGQSEEAKNDQEFVEYLSKLYIEIKQNSINFDVVVNLIDKIKSLEYNAEGVKVYFNN